VTKRRLIPPLSLRGKILLLSFLVAFISTAVIGLVVFLSGSRALTKSINDALLKAANFEANSIDRYINNCLEEVKLAAVSEAVTSLEAERILPVFDTYLETIGDIEGFYIIDSNGLSTINSAGKAVDFSNDIHVTALIQGVESISVPFIINQTGSIGFAIAAPIKSGSNTDDKLLAYVSLSSLLPELQALRIGDSGEAFLINKEGYLITPSRFESQLREKNIVKKRSEFEARISPQIIREVFQGKPGVADEFKDYLSRSVVAAYAPISTTGWGIIITQERREIYSQVISMQRTLIWGFIFIAVIGVLVSFFLTNQIARSLNGVTMFAKGLSRGELDQELNSSLRKRVASRNDELGQISKTLEETVGYFRRMGGVAGKIADGDLTVNVTALSSKDELGNAFEKMVMNLRNLVSQLTDSSHNVSRASKELAVVSEQAGQVISQIAVTIQQVAKGTAEQSEDATRTANAVEKLTRAIDDVAQGAQEQAAAVDKMASIAVEISDGLKKVYGNASSVMENSNAAAQIARSGVSTVGETTQLMHNIRDKVNQSVQKVEEMGKRSQQIGAISETIDEIASQTNLLALNAAIEAAKAGQHGKGFGVVADEVRRLADRSSQATKEIDNLIVDIQKAIAEAVAAMDESKHEVDVGVAQTGEAGQALESILKAVEVVSQRAQGSVNSAQQMGALANELSQANEVVYSVIERNDAATKEMAARSNDVMQAIENIASVSEQNNAAVEEVSAATEQMNAQTTELTASAQSLARMSQALLDLVNQFRL
jgi:methyl-accepting chemotaxis protein